MTDTETARTTGNSNEAETAALTDPPAEPETTNTPPKETLDPAETEESISEKEETETAEVKSEESVEDDDTPKKDNDNDPSKGPVLTLSGKKRPPYKYDPKKVTLRFVFANKDGISITLECDPDQTVGEVKGALLSVWPDGKLLLAVLFDP
jgi:hypothetical protein